MLIQQPLTVGDVACVRLITGEEMIGRVAALPDNGSSLTVTKPILLQIHVDPQTGQPVGIGFGAFMVGIDEESKIQIKREHMLVTPLKARDDLITKYQEMTGNIVVPKKPGIII